MRTVVFLTPVARYGFVPRDPEHNPIRYILTNYHDLQLTACGQRSWASAEDACTAAEMAGYFVPPDNWDGVHPDEGRK